MNTHIFDSRIKRYPQKYPLGENVTFASKRRAEKLTRKAKSKKQWKSSHVALEQQPKLIKRQGFRLILQKQAAKHSLRFFSSRTKIQFGNVAAQDQMCPMSFAKFTLFLVS